MECKILLILILVVVSTKKVQSKTFACNNVKEDFVTRCTITGVLAQDSEINLKSDTAVRNLKILNSTINDIPAISNECLQLNTLRSLHCVQCGLRGIKNHSFRQLSSFYELDISYGSYEKLEESLFSQLSEVRRLNVSHGAIGDIDDGAFSNLEELRKFDLSFNNITKITHKMFMPLKKLEEIDLSHNHIQILDKGLFIDNTELLAIQLGHNDINRIDGKILSPEPSIKFCHIGWRRNCAIDLSYNKLEALDIVLVKRSFIQADHNRLKRLSISSGVHILDASDNDIQNVVCEKDAKIDELNLQNNSLNDLGCIRSLTQLTKLNLNLNNIGRLNQSTFAELTELRYLRLKSTNISKLDDGVFSHQKKMFLLDVSYNKISNINWNILAAAENLLYLYIDGNNMTEFSYVDAKFFITQLTTLSIADNHFNCSFLGQAVVRLNHDGVEVITAFKGNKVKGTKNVIGIGCHDKSDSNRNLIIILITLIVVSILVLTIIKGYKIVKNRGRYHSTDTLHIITEMR